MKKHFSRPHIGKVPMKFYFRAQEITLLLPGMDVTGKLILTWKRGPRRTETEPFAVKETLNNVDGSLVRSASTSQDLALICTMFKNSKTGGFESKSAVFVLTEEVEGEERPRKLGTTSIDLSSYATPDLSSEPVELSFLDGKIMLKLQLTSHWLKHMRGAASGDGSEGGSVNSFVSDASALAPDGKGERPSLGSLPQYPAGTSRSSGGKAPFTMMDPEEKARLEDLREEQIEKSWIQEEIRANGIEEADRLRDDLQLALDKLRHSEDDAKYHREKADRLSQENRVLRREQRGGKRDEVILQLETELQVKEDERADMEENLAAAFSEVVKDLSNRVQSLTLERDRLMVELEAATGRRGGFKAK